MFNFVPPPKNPSFPYVPQVWRLVITYYILAHQYLLPLAPSVKAVVNKPQFCVGVWDVATVRY